MVDNVYRGPGAKRGPSRHREREKRKIKKRRGKDGGPESRGVTVIFFWGVKAIFLYFFPVENSHFGTSKTNFRRFRKWKAKKKKKKKRSSPLFITFPTSISNCPSSLLQFSFFSSQFSPLFPLPFFFPIRKQKFPGQNSLGGTLPPACYATAGESVVRGPQTSSLCHCMTGCLYCVTWYLNLFCHHFARNLFIFLKLFLS